VAGLGIGAVAEQGSDGADRQGGHYQHGVADECGVQPGLALVQAEAAVLMAFSAAADATLRLISDAVLDSSR
jgi:hypothetical protein